MKEKSIAKNHGGGIIAGAIIEKRSLRGNHWKENHREHLKGIWEAQEASGTPKTSNALWVNYESVEEASGRHPGAIWKASGRHPGGIWKASGRRPGGIWEASRRARKISQMVPWSLSAKNSKCIMSKLWVCRYLCDSHSFPKSWGGGMAVAPPICLGPWKAWAHTDACAAVQAFMPHGPG